MPSNAAERRRGVLFDLDGTFADTAPDLGAALNSLRAARGEAPVPLATLRPYTSQGVRGMLGAGLGIRPGHAAYADLHRRFLEHYALHLCRQTRLFAGIGELVDALVAGGTEWGIVTNKPQRFTLPLLRDLGVITRAGCVVSGDASPRSKPDPHPLHLGAALLGLASDACIYVGDDRRDIDAGRAAGMMTIAVRYGYLGDGGPIEAWGADHVVDHPLEIGALIAG